MPEPLRVHRAPVKDEQPQRRQSGFREKGARSPVGDPHLDQLALQHALHCRRDLRLVAPLAGAPGAQEKCRQRSPGPARSAGTTHGEAGPVRMR
jgi:hypothetical protein